MPGFANNIVYADNVRFDGNSYPGQVNADGQLLIGSTVSPNIRVATLTAGPGINIANASGSITISGPGTGLVWSAPTSATNPNVIAVGHGYIPKGAGAVTFVLPAAAAVGDTFIIAGYGNLWTITQNALQSITLGAFATSVGVGGSMSATNIRDTVTIVCVSTNLEFQVISVIGNPIIT